MISFGITSRNTLNALLDIDVGLTISEHQVNDEVGYSGLKNEDLKNIKLLKNRDHCRCTEENLLKQVDFFDEIHLDIFKYDKIDSVSEAIYLLEKYIDFCLSHNPNLKFEIGTEESVFKYPEDFLEKLLKIQAHNIKWVVVQGGEYVDCLSNKNRLVDNLKEQCDLVHSYGFLSKAHNCDFLPIEDLIKRKECGVDGFNFGPEISFFENQILLEGLSDDQQSDILRMVDRRWFKDCQPTNHDLLLGNLHYFYSLQSDEIKDSIKTFIKNRHLKLCTPPQFS